VTAGAAVWADATVLTAAAPVVPVVPVVPLVLVFVVVGVWSDSNVAFAWARDAWAAVSALCSGRGFMVAKVWPAVTVSPTATGTLVTVPATGKL
jgi:hypothetical protein